MLRRVARLYMGTTFPDRYQGQSTGDLPFVKVADFATADGHGRIITAENWITEEVASELRARVVPADSVVFARVGAALLLNQRRLVTRPSVVDDNVRGLAFQVGDPRFWLYLLRLLDLRALANPGPVPSVGEEQIMSIRVPLPEPAEQAAIADRIERVEDENAELRSALTRQIDLLTEHRQALITAAVTGELAVSGAAT